MNHLLLTVFRLYVYSLPFTYALSLYDGRITISLMLSGLLTALLAARLIRSTISMPRLGQVFLFFSAFILSLSFGLLLSDSVSNKSVNHLMAYCVSIVAFGLIPMLAVANLSRPGWQSVLLRDIMWTARFAAGAAIIQFISSNFFGVLFEDWIYYPETIEVQSRFLGIFLRSRGFAAEPGHYAFILELLAPLLIYGHGIQKFKSVLSASIDLLLIVLALLCTGSPAGLLILGAGLLISCLLFPSRRLMPLISAVILTLVLAIGIVIIVSNYTQSNWQELLTSLFVDKLDSSSAYERGERIAVGVRLIEDASSLQLLFGYGPAVYESQNLGEKTVIQFYQLLFLEGGAIGMALFLSAFLFLAHRAIKQLKSDKLFYFWPFLNIALHYLFISNYYYPMIWFMFPLLLIMVATQDKNLHIDILTVPKTSSRYS